VFWLPDDLNPLVRPENAEVGDLFVREVRSELGRLQDTLGEEADPIALTSASIELSAVRDQCEGVLAVDRIVTPEGAVASVRSRRYLVLGNKIEAVQFTDLRDAAHLHVLTESKIHGYSLPTHPALHTRREPLARPPGFIRHSFQQRSGKFGIVAQPALAYGPLVMPLRTQLQPFQLHLPDADGLVARYGEYLEGRAAPSANGQLAREVARKLGGLGEAGRRLRSPEIIALLDAFITRDNGLRGQMDFKGRLLLRPAAVRQRLKSFFKERDECDRLTSDLANRGIIHYGLALRCPVCSLSSFYRWADIADDGVRCAQCRRVFPATPERACGWAPVAAIDEVVLAGISNHAIEEILTAACLEDNEGPGMLALGVSWNLGTLNAESDAAGVIRSDFTVVEAKSNREIDNKQLGRIQALASRTRARRVVFATSADSWNSRTMTRIETMRSGLPGTQIDVLLRVRETGGPVQVRA
jgi:hypothetical protein